MPLKNMYCRSLLRSRLQRFSMLMMWRGSSHLSLRTDGIDFLRNLLAPALHVPVQNVIAGLRGRLRLQHDRMPALRAGIEERARHAAVRVAVDAVRADRRDELGHQLPVGLAVRPRAVVPGHRRQEHLDAAPMEIGDRAAQPGEAARQIVREVELVAIVDADVRVDVPEQHAVDAAVAALQIVEVTLHGVAARDRIVEVAVLDHHQRVHEIALRPLQPRVAIQRVVVAEPDQVLVAPLAQAADPVVAVRVDVDHPVADARERPARRRARQRQVRAGERVRELEAGRRSHHEWNDRTPQYWASSSTAPVRPSAWERSSASTSCVPGMLDCAPTRVVARAAAALARRSACGRGDPEHSAAASAPQKVSPAAVVSTGSTLKAGCR